MNLTIKILMFATILFLSYESVHAQSVEELMGSGNSLLQNGAFDQAISKFRKVLSRDPGNFEAQFNLALAYLSSNRYDNAVTEFRKALAINKASAEGWSNLAVAYDRLGQNENAIEALNQAVRNNPSNFEARMNLASVYVAKEKYSEAIAQYKQIISIDNQVLEAHLNMAKCYIMLNKPADARQELKTVLMINPNDAEAYWELGNLSWKKDANQRDAIQNYNKAISLQPNSQVFYENLALLLEEMKQKEDAIETWQKSLIYLDDPLKKEKVQDHIAALERGETATTREAPGAVIGTKNRTEDISRLKDELRSEEKSDPNNRVIETEDVDVMKDLDEMDNAKKSPFDIDMKKAVKDKKASKALGE
jgi:superkiller protein 3